MIIRLVKNHVWLTISLRSVAAWNIDFQEVIIILVTRWTNQQVSSRIASSALRGALMLPISTETRNEKTFFSITLYMGNTGSANNGKLYLIKFSILFITSPVAQPLDCDLAES